MKLKRRLLFIELTVLGLIGLLGDSTALTVDMGGLSDAPQYKMAQDNLTIVIPPKKMERAPLDFHIWSGFALKDNESYILRISIESIRPVGPMGARRFLASNMTIEEIKKEILTKEKNLTYIGYIKVGESAYRLVNINMTQDSKNFTLNAGIADLKESLAHEIIATNVGRIEVNAANNEGTIKGQGEMILTYGPRIGRYQLMINMDPMPSGQG